MSPVKAVIFDFFGVICVDSHTQWIRKNGYDDRMHELIDAYYQYSDVGKLSTAELYEDLGKLVGRDPDEVRKEIHAFEAIDKEVVRVIQALRARGYRTGLCSNAPAGYVEQIMQDHGIVIDFDSVTISSAVGVRKPDAAIFEYALKGLDSNAHETLFIDDNLYNVEGARAVGIDAIHYTAYTDLPSELRTRGIDITPA